MRCYVGLCHGRKAESCGGALDSPSLSVAMGMFVTACGEVHRRVVATACVHPSLNEVQLMDGVLSNGIAKTGFESR